MIALAFVLAPWFTSPETALIFGWMAVILISLMGGPYLGTLFAYVPATLLRHDLVICFLFLFLLRCLLASPTIPGVSSR